MAQGTHYTDEMAAITKATPAAVQRSTLIGLIDIKNTKTVKMHYINTLHVMLIRRGGNILYNLVKRHGAHLKILILIFHRLDSIIPITLL